MKLLKKYLLFILFVLIINNVHSQWVKTNGPYCGSISNLHMNKNKFFATTFEGGKFFSNDNGNTWVALQNQVDGVLGVCNNSLYIGNSNGIFVSSDDGKNWDKINSGFNNLKVLEICDSILYAGTQTGLFSSSDFGYAPWNNMGLVGTAISSIAVKDTFLFAGTYESGIYSFMKRDSSWVNLGLQYNYISSIQISNNRIFVGSFENGVFYSTDFGKIWINTELPPSVQTIFSNDTLVVAGTMVGGYVYITHDLGDNWLIRHPGISINSVVAKGENVYAGVTRDGFLRSSNEGIDWEVANQGITGTITSYAKSGSDLIVGTEINGIFLSSDNGEIWRAIGSKIIHGQIRALAIQDSTIIAGSDFGVFYSLDKGETWTKSATVDDIYCIGIYKNETYIGSTNGISFSTDFGKTWVNGNYDKSVLAILKVADTLWIGTAYGIYYTNDNGNHWYHKGLENYAITAIAYTDNNILVGTSSGHLIKSEDNGAAWHVINFDSSMNNWITSIVEIDGKILVCIKGVGIFLSSSTENEWIDVNEDLSFRKTNYLFANSTYLFVGTRAGSVWRRSKKDIISTSIPEPEVLYTNFLHQNYPNPFNPTTNISFSLKENTIVRLDIYDILGRKVKTLLNEFRLAGNYRITFNGIGLSTGIYLYKIKTENFTQTKKMIFIK